jgi:serine/threonine-protein kinase RIO1
VHGDLSAFNLLWRTTAAAAGARADSGGGADGVPGSSSSSSSSSKSGDGTAYVIDLGQAVDVHHPRALELLRRDLHNLRTFFARRGVPVHATAALEALVVQPDALPDGGPSSGPGSSTVHRGGCGDEAVVADALDRLEVACLQEQAQRRAPNACADGDDNDAGGNDGASASGTKAPP